MVCSFTRRALRLLALCAGIVVCLITPPQIAHAQSKPIALIRDAEIESIIRAYATPLFLAAGLSHQNVSIYLVNDKALNAFVAGGQNLFINSGLLLKSDNAGQVIGVIAHETGHIAGGHLSRTHQALQNANRSVLLSTVLGIVAGIATGNTEVGQAIVMGGQQTGVRSFLKYSRAQESAADQAALRLLDTTQQSSSDLLAFMEKLEGQELINLSRRDPYLLTHPLSRERIETLREHATNSPLRDKTQDTATHEAFERMQAKLYAFTYPLKWTLRKYPPSDTSLAARYARAVAYYRVPQLEQALELIDGLIRERPSDPYFHELKGQMLFENGRGREALPSYETAVGILPTEPLLSKELGRIQIETGDPALLESAVENLKKSLRHDRDAPDAWRMLGVAYGRLNDMGRSALSLAESALGYNNPSEAIYHAEKARELLPHGSREWLQASDVLDAANLALSHLKKAQ